MQIRSKKPRTVALKFNLYAYLKETTATTQDS